jgi:hypothetical protein
LIISYRYEFSWWAPSYLFGDYLSRRIIFLLIILKRELILIAKLNKIYFFDGFSCLFKGDLFLQINFFLDRWYSFDQWFQFDVFLFYSCNRICFKKVNYFFRCFIDNFWKVRDLWKKVFFLELEIFEHLSHIGKII